MRLTVLLAAVLGLALGLSGGAAAEPRRLNVLTEVEFNAEGQAETLRFLRAEGFSQGFMEGLRERVLRIRIPPPQHEREPARFRSGMVLRVEIEESEGQGRVRLAGIQLQPLVLKADAAPTPDAYANFDRLYLAHCIISTEGLCEVDRVEAEGGGVEEAMRRWVLATMKLWLFLPPTLNGHPIVSQQVVRLRLRTLPEEAYAPPDFRLGTRLNHAPNAWR